MIHPAIVTELRKILAPGDGWQISMAIHVPDKRGVWPAMVITIRAQEIMDGLKREHFPEPYRSFQYEGSRPETDID